MNDEHDVEIDAEAAENRRAQGEEMDTVDETSASGKVAKLKKELEQAKKEKQEYLDGWQRSKADYVNLLHRTEESTKEFELKGRMKAVETLLPAFDALERAREHGEVPEGFLAIAKKIESAFAALGLEEIGVVGESFNPAYHDALGQDVVESKKQDDTVTAVLEKGWRVGEQVLRPAKVRVAHVAE